jgi:hypothetical protein
VSAGAIAWCPTRSEATAHYSSGVQDTLAQTGHARELSDDEAELVDASFQLARRIDVCAAAIRAWRHAQSIAVRRA